MSIDGGVPSDQAIGTHDAGFDSLAGLHDREQRDHAAQRKIDTLDCISGLVPRQWPSLGCGGWWHLPHCRRRCKTRARYISSIGSYISAAGLIAFFAAIAHAFIRKTQATANPWGVGATTLEWTLPSPPPFHQYETLPRVE